MLDHKNKKVSCEIQLEHFNNVLSDLSIFGSETMKEDYNKLAGIIDRIKVDDYDKLVQRQKRYSEFENNYFALVNQSKRDSILVKKQTMK